MTLIIFYFSGDDVKETDDGEDDDNDDNANDDGFFYM